MYSDIMYSDRLKLVRRFATSNHVALFKSKVGSWSTPSCVYDISSRLIVCGTNRHLSKIRSKNEIFNDKLRSD